MFVFYIISITYKIFSKFIATLVFGFQSLYICDCGVAEFFFMDVLKSKKNLLKNVRKKPGRCAQNLIRIVFKIIEKNQVYV